MRSRWKQLTEEQKQKARETERQRRNARKQQMTDADRLKLSEQRKQARMRRKARNPEHHLQVQRAYNRGNGWYIMWLSSIRERARAKNVPFNLTVDHLKSLMVTHCPVLGIKLDRRSSRRDNAPGAPTVDRIVPELGYVEGNVIIISKRANQIKSDATPDEIRKVADFFEMWYNTNTVSKSS